MKKNAIHKNNISEILLFEYFRNMYPCHRRLTNFDLNINFPSKSKAVTFTHFLTPTVPEKRDEQM